ncbi:MAG: hypothetical protein V3U16_05145 [Candidatus Neomarinimicrobiota bacterium]
MINKRICSFLILLLSLEPAILLAQSDQTIDKTDYYEKGQQAAKEDLLPSNLDKTVSCVGDIFPLAIIPALFLKSKQVEKYDRAIPAKYAEGLTTEQWDEFQKGYNDYRLDAQSNASKKAGIIVFVFLGLTVAVLLYLSTAFSPMM